MKFIPSVRTVLRPRPVPKPRVRSQTAATSGYVAKLEINDSGYDGSPRGISAVLIIRNNVDFLQHMEQVMCSICAMCYLCYELCYQSKE